VKFLKRKTGFLILFCLIAGFSSLFYVSIYFGYNLEWILNYANFFLNTYWGLRIIGVPATFVSAFLVYRLSSRAIRAALKRASGTEGDILMLLDLWRIAVFFIALLVVMAVFFEFGILTAALGAFGGLFMGWSLQPLVSGFAAWLLVTLRRPFKVGDRVQLPSSSLVGDVAEVGPMYTVLSQVGGAVGSEEPVGRHILIPNAMLFGNLIINYTPKIKEENLLSTLQESNESTYILDEVVVRITYTADWNAAENILLAVAKEVTGNIIEETGQEPYIRSDMYDYGVWMRLRYMTLAKDRPRIKYLIEKRIFQEFQENEQVDFAIPYVYSAKKGAKRE
jgi:small-conductance mechanosensitive channel